MNPRIPLGVVLLSAALSPMACSSNAPDERIGQDGLAWTNGTPPCGTTIATWGNLNAYSNGTCFGNVNCVNCDGQGFSVHTSPSNGQKAYGGAWQCVELVTRYLDTTYGIWLSNNAGSPLCNSAAATGGLTVYGPGYSSATPEPVPGDALVWNYSGGPGHTGLVTGASGSTLDYIEQNWGSPTGYAGTGHTPWNGSFFGVPSDSLGGFTPVCWIHANANTSKSCPLGDGLYCGGHLVGGTAGTLYQCTGGNLTVVSVCSLGCQNEPNGTNDQCVQCPNGDGTYCGGHGIPGTMGTLYKCAGGIVTTSMVCPYGCQNEATGTNDRCAAAPVSDAGAPRDSGAPTDSGAPPKDSGGGTASESGSPPPPQAEAGTPGDDGAASSGVAPGQTSNGGCACTSAGARREGPSVFALLGFGIIALTRRARRRRGR